MKNLIFLLAILALPAVAFSQKIDVEAIKADTCYIYGEATGFTEEEADKAALQKLIQKISLRVKSYTSSTAEENTIGGVHTSNSKFASSIETYSHASLGFTQYMVLSTDPEVHVIRWMKKSDIEKMFELRKFKIKDLIMAAGEGEKNRKIDIALQYYYKAFLLLQTLQYPDELMYTPQGDSIPHPCTTYIPMQMDNIFSSLKAFVTGKRDDGLLELYFTYNGQPVSSVDYTFVDEHNKGSFHSASDGIGTIDLPSDYSSKYINLKYEYMYYSQRFIDEDIKSVFEMKGIDRKTFEGAKKKIPSGIKRVPKVEKVKVVLDNDVTAAISEKRDAIKREVVPKMVDNTSLYRKRIDFLLDAIEKKQYNNADSLFTPDGAAIFKELLKYGRARIVGKPDYKFYPNGDEVMARGGQMTFSFANGARKSFVEEVVFTFNKEHKICNISFGLGNDAVKDILYKGAWDEKARITMMSFLENYKTAYALKRLDYIETIFDDDAVIITGKKVYKAPKTGPGEEIVISTKGMETIEYNRMNKSEFLKHLKMCFEGKEFINIRFAENRVRKMAVGGEFYAIEIAQDYYSSNYGDKGYLLLMVDINDPKKPIIKVRTWQPEKDPKFGLYGPGDFL